MPILDTLLSVICSNGKKSLPLVKEVLADEEGQMERRVVVPPALTLKTAAAILNENGFDCSVVDGVVLVRSQYLVKRGQSCFDIALKGFEDRGNIRELLNKLMTACDKSGVSVAVGFGTRTKFDQQQHVLSTPENGTIGDVLLQLSKTGGPGLSLVVVHPKTASSKAEVFLSLP